RRMVTGRWRLPPRRPSTCSEHGQIPVVRASTPRCRCSFASVSNHTREQGPSGPSERRARVPTMAWDFETEPDFQEKLDWMREVPDRELLPLETIEYDVPNEQWAQLTNPLKAEVKRQGLWACHLDRELGG